MSSRERHGEHPIDITFGIPDLGHAQEIREVHLASFVEGTVSEAHGAPRIVVEQAVRDIKKTPNTRWESAIADMNEDHKILVARHIGHIVGVAEVEKKEEEYWLSSLYVLPVLLDKPLFGLGIGSRLLEQVCPVGQTTYLFVTEWASAHAFYLRHNFVPTDKHKLPHDEFPNGGRLPNGTIVRLVELVRSPETPHQLPAGKN